MAHAHFPKEFKMIELCGPKIPASLTISEIPLKRGIIPEYKYKFASKIINNSFKIIENPNETYGGKVEKLPRKKLIDPKENQNYIRVSDYVSSNALLSQNKKEELKEEKYESQSEKSESEEKTYVENSDETLSEYSEETEESEYETD